LTCDDGLTAGEYLLDNLANFDDPFRRSTTDCQLDFADCLGDLNFTRAGGGAVVNRTAAPDTIRFCQRIQTIFGSFIAGIEDEAVCLHNRCRSNIFAIRPEGRAGCGAARAQDTLGRIVEGFTVFLRLIALADQSLFIGLDLRIVDEIRHHRTIVLEEGFHIDHQILEHR